MLNPLSRKTRVIWQRLDCLKFNPVWVIVPPAVRASENGVDLCGGFPFHPLSYLLDSRNSEGQTADNESDEGMSELPKSRYDVAPQ